ncbi:hypothetical protein [Saccharothrix sp. HUAS TT1]|uniref:hypothetical protein n=1 Tax=unclassified Saccharothrix TaxID=2593673 RepID=UPI00345B849B
MNGEDDFDGELRAFLADDRLALPVRPGAVEALAARGARRARRRAMASAGAAAAVVLAAAGGVTAVVLRGPGAGPAASGVVGTVTVTVAPPPGFGELRLGTGEREALATGLLGSPTDLPGGCRQYPAGDGAVAVVAPGRGVVRLTLPRSGETVAGIRIGSPTTDVEAAYGTSARPDAEGLVVPMPGQPPWRYSFSAEAGRVTAVRVEVEDTPCG